MEANCASCKVQGMVLLFAAAMLGSMAIAQSSPPGQTSGAEKAVSANASVARSTLPPMPKGKSTVIGGEIRNVDPVRDQFTLNVFGGGPHLKILYDERTQAYRSGKRISVLQLHPEEHASIETTLDGTKIFALQIHVLTQLPEGECRGQVLSYNPQTGELEINEELSQEAITVRVPSDTPIARVGQSTFTAQQSGLSDLGRGTLVDVKFESSKGHGVATHVDILATPGSAFVFSGNLSFLDANAGRLVIVDANDNQSYQVSFDPSRFPVSSKLHEGSRVKVTTSFDGSKYVASDIMIE
jgi:hypothetical protein